MSGRVAPVHYLIVLSPEGEKKLKNENVGIMNGFEYYVEGFAKKQRIREMVMNPTGYLFGDDVLLFQLLNKTSKDIYNGSAVFNIYEVLEGYENSAKVLGLYENLINNVINPLNKYFCKVSFVGQLSAYPISVYMREMNTHYQNVFISETESGVFTDSNELSETSILYDELNKKIRGWYVTDEMKKAINRCYAANHDGTISWVKDLVPTKGKKEKKERGEVVYEVADVYPAFKLIMSLMLLISFYPNFSEKATNSNVKYKLDEYMQMLAAYLLYDFADFLGLILRPRKCPKIPVF